jgi:hypothetical protein
MRALLAAAALGCSSGTPAPAPSGGGLQGGFVVDFREAAALTMSPAFGAVTGKVYDGPVPAGLQLVLDRQQGDCKLFKPLAPFCDPTCTGGVCVEDGRCQAYPQLQDVGVVRVTGLAGGELALEPAVPQKPDYQSAALPHPPCEEGGVVGVRADTFAIDGKCIAPLALTTAVPIPVRRDQPVKLAWNAPSVAGLGHVKLHLDIAHHGGKKGEIDCDTLDTGGFEIPAALVTALLNLGVAGFPTITLTRETRATASTAPGVTLAISSSLEREVDTGFVDCSETKPCPAAQTCDTTVYLCK